MNIRCKIGWHAYTKWKHVEKILRNVDILQRRCKRCGKEELYEGVTIRCVKTGNKYPY